MKSVLFHSVGLGSIGGAIFLQILTFHQILKTGYFMAIEPNFVILAAELFVSIFAVAYFVYLCLNSVAEINAR